MIQQIARVIYGTLEAIGYPHPLHPQLTHLTIGLVFGAFLLGLLSLLIRHRYMGIAAGYCAVISLLSVFVTAATGYLDWQHFFAGGWLLSITIKLVLAGVLLVVLVIAILAGRHSDSTTRSRFVFYTLSFLAVVGLGYFGGQIVYKERSPAAPRQFAAGERLFRGNCSGCHPYGSNIVDPDAAIRGSDKLKDYQTFLGWLRDPRLANGKRGIMPPFSESRINDKDVKLLFDYIIRVTTQAGGEEKEHHERLKHDEQRGRIEVPAVQVKTDPKSVENGRALFEANCTRCHLADTTRPKVGPGLQGILKRDKLPVSARPATPGNVYQQITNPYRSMPSFSGKLSTEQINDAISFLNTL